MSKSSRTSHPHAGKSNKRATAPAAAHDARTRPHGHRKVIGGIDYGPALAAVRDLATWAFDLAERDVADWPEGLRRVRGVRRFVFDHLRGKRPHAFSVEDLMFTTGVFVRIFEAGPHLPTADMMAFLSRLGFPTEAVRAWHAPSVSCWPQDPSHTPTTPLGARPAAAATRPSPADVCEGCSQLGRRFRFVA